MSLKREVGVFRRMKKRLHYKPGEENKKDIEEMNSFGERKSQCGTELLHGKGTCLFGHTLQVTSG